MFFPLLPTQKLKRRVPRTLPWTRTLLIDLTMLPSVCVYDINNSSNKSLSQRTIHLSMLSSLLLLISSSSSIDVVIATKILLGVKDLTVVFVVLFWF